MPARERIYLDYNATAPVFPAVAAAVADALHLANPSSVHAEGRAARAAVERARAQVADLVGAARENIVFTSGGSEGANLLLKGLTTSDGRPLRLLLGGTEHACVQGGHDFPPNAVTRLAVDTGGVLLPESLEQALRLASAAGERVLLALQLANNETGTLQPVRQAADLVHAHGGLVVCDAVQAAGKIPVSLPMLGADALFISAHKIGGPKGVGAVALNGGDTTLHPLVAGGGQELGRRGGTENVAGIVGFGVAADIVGGKFDQMERVRGLRDRLEQGIAAQAPEAVVFSQKAERLPNTCAVALPGLRAETALIAFDLDGVAVSSGAACSSGKVRRSAVLDAMGIPGELAEGAIRISLGWNTTEDHIEACLAAFARRIPAARANSRERAA